MGLIFFQRYYYRKETKELLVQFDEQHAQAEQEVQQTKQALTALKNKQLIQEIEHKNKTLTTTTMHLVQKGEILKKIRNELSTIQKGSANLEEYQQKIKSIIRLIQSDRNREEDWQQFAYHFDQVHNQFLLKLKKQFPNLTPNDYKLCAFLRMNLNSKEIASLMNVTIRGVEASRYRLRKKLQLPSERNLVDFMLEI